MPFPACRHADGTISSSDVSDVWRMASEDSDEIVSGFLPVHRLHDLGDLRQTVTGQMVTASHEFDAVRKLLEVVPLCRAQGVLPEEWNDPFQQIASPTDRVAMYVDAPDGCRPAD